VRYQHGQYALGNMGKASVATLFDYFALFYLTDVLGIPALIAGNLILISLVWDGLTDPWIAILIDKLRKRFSTVKLYFLVGSPCTAIAAFSFFNAHRVTEDYVLLYTTVVLLIYRTVYTIVDVPHNSLLSFIATEARQRTKIAAMRIFFSSLGRFLVTAMSVDFLVNDSMPAMQASFSNAALMFSILFLLIMAVCLNAVKQVSIVHSKESLTEFKFFDLFKLLWLNKAVLLVFFITAVTSVTTHALGSGIIYFAKYALLDESKGGVALTILSFSQAIFLVMWVYCANDFLNVWKASVLANSILIVTLIAALLGITSNFHLYIFCFFAGAALSGIYMFNWVLLPMAIDQFPQANRRRYDMSIFGFYTLTNKVCHGLSLAFVGWILQFNDYVADSRLAEESIDDVFFTILLLPLVGSIICIWLLNKFGKISSNQTNGNNIDEDKPNKDNDP